MKIRFISPVRFASSRFPGKSLAKTKGVPILLKTYKQSTKAIGYKDLYVATYSKKILKFYKKNKIKFCLTSNKCLTRTDRVAEFFKKSKYL